MTNGVNDKSTNFVKCGIGAWLWLFVVTNYIPTLEELL